MRPGTMKIRFYLANVNCTVVGMENRLGSIKVGTE